MAPTVLVQDRVGTIIAAHGGHGRPLGFRPEELIGRNSLEFVAPEDQEALIDQYAQVGEVVTEAPLQSFPLHIIGPDGATSVWDVMPVGLDTEAGGYLSTLIRRASMNASLHAASEFASGGGALDIAGKVSDTFAVSSQGAIAESFLLHRSWTREDDRLGDWKMTPDTRWSGLSDVVRACLNDPDAPWGSAPLDTLRIVSDELPEPVAARARELGIPNCRIATVALHGANRLCFLQFSHLEQLAESNAHLAHASTAPLLKRVMREEHNSALLARAALVDPLTGLANRRALDEQLPPQEASTVTTVLYVDIDNFKTINDRHGHRIGDRAIQHVANQLKACSRNGDLLVRMGGDEFVLVAERAAADQGDRIADRLTEAVRQPFRVDGTELRIEVSIGVGRSETGESLEETIDRADRLMLAAKRRRKST